MSQSLDFYRNQRRQSDNEWMTKSIINSIFIIDFPWTQKLNENGKNYNKISIFYNIRGLDTYLSICMRHTQKNKLHNLTLNYLMNKD